MTDIKCKVIPEPLHDHKTVFRQSSTESPYLNGDDYDDGNDVKKMSYLCGNCDFVLAKNIHIDQITQLLTPNNKGIEIVLQCPKCGRYNELSSDMPPL